METALFTDIEKIVNRTDVLLWRAYDSAIRGTLRHLESRLIFPTYASGKLRISEQEARFLFVRVLDDSGFRYSIETPTVCSYKQKGEKPSRASFDVTMRDNRANPLLNCEFKFGGISPRRKSSMSVKKDLEKLLCDPGDGLWFHLLEAVDNSTLSNILAIIARDVTTLLALRSSEIKLKSLLLHICVLRHHFSVYKEVIIDPGKAKEISLHEQLTLVYKVSRDKLCLAQETNGWRFYNKMP